VSLKLSHQALVFSFISSHILLLQALEHILGALAADLNPNLRKNGTGGQNEHNVNNPVNRISEQPCHTGGGTDIINQPGNRVRLSSIRSFFPLAEPPDQEEPSEPFVHHS
jgi:hypothetical protein